MFKDSLLTRLAICEIAPKLVGISKCTKSLIRYENVCLTTCIHEEIHIDAGFQTTCLVVFNSI